MFIDYILQIEERLRRGLVPMHRGTFIPMTEAALWISTYPGSNVVHEMESGMEALSAALGPIPPADAYIYETWDYGEDEEGLRDEGYGEWVSLSFVRKVAASRGNVAVARMIDTYLADLQELSGRSGADDVAEASTAETARDYRHRMLREAEEIEATKGAFGAIPALAKRYGVDVRNLRRKIDKARAELEEARREGEPPRRDPATWKPAGHPVQATPRATRKRAL